MAETTRIKRLDDTGAWIDDPVQDLGYMYPAQREDVDYVLNQDIEDDGRSDWTWVRLQDGTLILGIFPRGDTYFAIEPNMK